MLEHTFLQWLAKELIAVKCALLVAIEKKDQLIHVEAPLLRTEYMEKIGVFEEQALKLELEVVLMEKKKTLIQTVLNRREPLDMDKINGQIEKERAARMNKMKQNGKIGAVKKSVLNQEEKEQMQNLYKEITQNFHPEVNKNITENERTLYDSALKAYKNQNLEELELIHEMLFSEEAGNLLSNVTLEIAFRVREVDEEEKSKKLAEQIMEDYSLAGQLYSCYVPAREEAVLKERVKEYQEKEAVVLDEIQRTLQAFPFIARETLNNEEMTNEYLSDVKSRIVAAKTTLEKLEEEISIMAEE